MSLLIYSLIVNHYFLYYNSGLYFLFNFSSIIYSPYTINFRTKFAILTKASHSTFVIIVSNNLYWHIFTQNKRYAWGRKPHAYPGTYCADLNPSRSCSSTLLNASAEDTVASPRALTSSGNLSRLSFMVVYISK